VPAAFDDAVRQALLYQAVFLTPPTTDAIRNRPGLRTGHEEVAIKHVTGLRLKNAPARLVLRACLERRLSVGSQMTLPLGSCRFSCRIA
jgi:hypothetical protein